MTVKRFFKNIKNQSLDWLPNDISPDNQLCKAIASTLAVCTYLPDPHLQQVSLNNIRSFINDVPFLKTNDLTERTYDFYVFYLNQIDKLEGVSLTDFIEILKDQAGSVPTRHILSHKHVVSRLLEILSDRQQLNFLRGLNG